MKSSRMGLVIAALGVLALSLAGCSDDSSSGPPTTVMAGETFKVTAGEACTGNEAGISKLDDAVRDSDGDAEYKNRVVQIVLTTRGDFLAPGDRVRVLRVHGFPDQHARIEFASGDSKGDRCWMLATVLQHVAKRI